VPTTSERIAGDGDEILNSQVLNAILLIVSLYYSLRKFMKR